MAAKITRSDYTSTFEVLVGKAPNLQRFVVHKDPFCCRSKFFEAARSERWIAESAKPTELLDTKPAVFHDYIHCVYAGKIVPADADKNLEPDFGAYISLYLLADKLQDLVTANLVVDEIIRFSAQAHLVPAMAEVADVYVATAPNNPLRRLLRDFRIYDAVVPQGAIEDKPGMTEALWDMHQETSKQLKAHGSEKAETVFRRGPSRKPKCHYHQHDNEHQNCDDK